MFSAVSFQHSVRGIILSVTFPGLYCGIHMEARKLQVKCWDPFQAIKSMLLGDLFLLFAPSWCNFQPTP